MARSSWCQLIVETLCIALLLGCDGDRQQKQADTPSSAAQPVASNLPAVDDPLVQRRADWEELAHKLPAAPPAAAAALEEYRRRFGLPLAFYVPKDAPANLTARLNIEEDEGCGRGITAFARRVPLNHPVLGSDPVIELDTAGNILREWRVPNGSASPEAIVGVSGDEVIVRFSAPDSGVYLRYKPDGTYRVSAEPPTPLEPSLWIMVAESVYLRVHPKDDGPFTAGGSTVGRDDPGIWEPSGDSGWYKRVDSSGTGPRVARAVTRPWSDEPRMLRCPQTARVEGMICRGFPDGPTRRERRLAYPTPCS
jgi:hypothetical protein